MTALFRSARYQFIPLGIALDRKDHAIDLVPHTFVVDDRAGTELGYGEKPRA
jgi:hypothetical protein